MYIIAIIIKVLNCFLISCRQITLTSRTVNKRQVWTEIETAIFCPMTPIYIRPFPRVIVQEQDGHDLRLNVPNEIGLPNIEVEEAFLAIRGQNIGAAIELRQRLAIEARILAFTAARAQMRRDLETIRRLVRALSFLRVKHWAIYIVVCCVDRETLAKLNYYHS